MKKILIFTYCLASLVCYSYAQPGKLDSSFGTNGIVITNYPDEYNQYQSSAVLNDDKIVVSSYISGLSTAGILLTRYLPDGTLDITFGNQGFSAFNNMVIGSGLAVQPDGKIVIAGYMPIKGESRTTIAILRFLPDGSPDSSFANNGEYLDNTGRQLYAFDVALQPDGKIIICGRYDKDPDRGILYQMLARFNTDGSPDISFGDNGEKIHYSASTNSYAHVISLQANGKIVTGGIIGIGGSLSDHFYLACYQTDGEPDNAFGINGEVITDFDQNGEFITDITIQPDGKIIAVGAAHSPQWNRIIPYMAVARYNADGSFDESFGAGGKVKVVFDSSSQANSVALQGNGKIVIGGWWSSTTDGRFAIARLSDNGAIDSTFGTNGKTLTDINTPGDQILSLGIQKNGNIVASGQTNGGTISTSNIALARYLGDPSNPRPTIAQIKRWIRNHILHFEDANTNAAYYVIEKSTANNTGFVPVTRITANAATNNYSYTLPEAATQSTYRIKAVNKDNSITYSSPITSSDPAKAGVASFTIYPNPAKNRITVETSGTVQLRLQNSNGRVLLTQMVNGKGSIDISKLPNGIYYVVNTVNGESLKVVKE